MLGRDRRVDKCFTVVTLDENGPDLLPSKRNKGMIDAVIAGKKGLFNKGLGPGIGWAMVKYQQRHGFSQSHFIHKNKKIERSPLFSTLAIMGYMVGSYTTANLLLTRLHALNPPTTHFIEWHTLESTIHIDKILILTVCFGEPVIGTVAKNPLTIPIEVQEEAL